MLSRFVIFHQRGHLLINYAINKALKLTFYVTLRKTYATLRYGSKLRFDVTYTINNNQESTLASKKV